MNLTPRDNWLDLDSIFDNFFSPAKHSQINNGFWSPHVDVTERGDHFELIAELPGVQKEDIHVTVDQGRLTIEATNNSEDTEEKDGKVVRRERRSGKFIRSFTLGTDIHEEDINAKLSDGLLTLEIPKRKAPEPGKKKIQIQ